MHRGIPWDGPALIRKQRLHLRLLEQSKDCAARRRVVLLPIERDGMGLSRLLVRNSD